MTAPRTFQVKQLAELARVSVRTLHHYDEIGLLVPRGRTPAGYRLYSTDDVLRLQQIVICRELGLALEAIRRILHDPRADRRRIYLDHREQLRRRVQTTESMIRAVDAALDILNGTTTG